MFDAAVEAFDGNARVSEFVAQEVDDARDVALAIDALAFEFAGDFLVDVRFEDAQGAVFQLPFELGDAEAVRQRRQQVAGLQGEALLFGGAVAAEVAHEDDLQREFENDRAHVARHREEHFAQAFEVALFLFVQVVDEGEVVQRLQQRDDALAGVFYERFGVKVFFPPRRDEESGGEQAGIAAQVEQEFDEHLAAFVRRGRGAGGEFPRGGDKLARGGVSVVFLGGGEPVGTGGGVHSWISGRWVSAAIMQNRVPGCIPRCFPTVFTYSLSAQVYVNVMRRLLLTRLGCE